MNLLLPCNSMSIRHGPILSRPRVHLAGRVIWPWSLKLIDSPIESRGSTRALINVGDCQVPTAAPNYFDTLASRAGPSISLSRHTLTTIIIHPRFHLCDAIRFKAPFIHLRTMEGLVLALLQTQGTLIRGAVRGRMGRAA